MLELIASPQQVAFGQAKRDTLPAYCRRCDVRFACHGGCPKDRFTNTPDGEPGLNYLCPSFKRFFHHVQEPMRLMTVLLGQDRAPSELMQLYAARDARRGRNERARAAADANGNTATGRPQVLLSTAAKSAAGCR